MRINGEQDVVPSTRFARAAYRSLDTARCRGCLQHTWCIVSVHGNQRRCCVLLPRCALVEVCRRWHWTARGEPTHPTSLLPHTSQPHTHCRPTTPRPHPCHHSIRTSSGSALDADEGVTSAAVSCSSSTTAVPGSTSACMMSSTFSAQQQHTTPVQYHSGVALSGMSTTLQDTRRW